MKSSLITALAILLVTGLNTYAAPAEARLLEAARHNDLTQVQQLLADGADIEAADTHGNTALMISAAYGYAELARLLIDHGAEVNARGYIGNTALIDAVQEGYAEIARLLLDSGADVNARNQYGTSASSLALGWGRRDLAQSLAPSHPRHGLAGDVLGRKFTTALIALAAIVAVSTVTAAIHTEVSTTHSHV